MTHKKPQRCGIDVAYVYIFVYTCVWSVGNGVWGVGCEAKLPNEATPQPYDLAWRNAQSLISSERTELTSTCTSQCMKSVVKTYVFK